MWTKKHRTQQVHCHFFVKLFFIEWKLNLVEEIIKRAFLVNFEKSQTALAADQWPGERQDREGKS